MKKIAMLLLVVLTSIALLGCNNSEFKVDGEFTAFSVSVSSNAPVVTMVTVTVEKGEVVGYDIDVRQGTRTATVNDQGTEDTSDDTTTYAFSWKDQTKKQLGYEYKMFYSSYVATLDDASTATIEGYKTWLSDNGKLEWFEQANALESFWLDKGVDATEVDENGDFVNVASVSVSDSGYVALAKEALQLAKDGKLQAVYCSGTDLYIATMTVDAKGNTSDLKLDVHQATKSTTEGTFVWNELTKQGLGYNYKMFYSGYVASLDDASTATIEGYKTWLTENNKLEWFQQVDLITDYVSENGFSTDLKSISGKGVSLDGVNAIDGLSGVSISTDSYFEVLELLFAKLK